MMYLAGLNARFPPRSELEMKVYFIEESSGLIRVPELM